MFPIMNVYHSGGPATKLLQPHTAGVFDIYRHLILIPWIRPNSHMMTLIVDMHSGVPLREVTDR